MDNVSYHSHSTKQKRKKKRENPIKANKKADIVWLEQKDIFQNPSNSWTQLLNIVKEHEEKYRVYELDLIARKMGYNFCPIIINMIPLN